MGYQIASPDDVESVMDTDIGGMWFLKDALETDSLGFTVLELESGESNTEHDHADDGIEEVYYVMEGTVEIDLGDEAVTLDADEGIRLSPDQTRQIHNGGYDLARLVLVSAPV